MKKKAFEEIEELFVDNNYKLIDTDCNSVRDKLRFVCNEHQELGIQSVSFDNLNRGKVPCKDCMKQRDFNKKVREYRTLTENNGFEFIELFRENNHLKIKFICPKHKDKGIQITPTNLMKKKTNGKCNFCSSESTGELRRISKDKVVKEFTDKNYILLNINDYTNTNSVLKFICSKHEDLGIQETTFQYIRKGNTCHKCRYENTSGENHYSWMGGITSLTRYMRNEIQQWKLDSLIHYGFKCTITNRVDNLDVHHLINFSDLLIRVLNDLHLPIYETIGEYNELELSLIKTELLKLHYKHGFGVPIIKELHKLFHSEYGKHNNTPEQFEEFRERYHNEEFNDLLNKIS